MQHSMLFAPARSVQGCGEQSKTEQGAQNEKSWEDKEILVKILGTGRGQGAQNSPWLLVRQRQGECGTRYTLLLNGASASVLSALLSFLSWPFCKCPALLPKAGTGRRWEREPVGGVV